MKFARHITEFFVDNAKYYLVDKQGNKVTINVNYSDNTYALDISGKNGKIENTKREADRIASELLSRKSMKNLADKAR